MSQKTLSTLAVQRKLRVAGTSPAVELTAAKSAWQEKVVALTAANILAMNGAPVAILAAPGAGKALIVESIVVEVKRTSTAFANGGAVSFTYTTTTTSVPHAGSIPATVFTGAAGTVVHALGPNVGTNGLVIPANEGISITNATAAFITGTGTAYVWVKYRIVTLQ